MNYYNDQFAKDIEGQARKTFIPGLDWQDVAQELDWALYRGMTKFKEGKGAGKRTYAMAIMRNRIKDLAKAAGRQKRFLDSNCLVFSEIETWENGETVLETAEPIGIF